MHPLFSSACAALEFSLSRTALTVRKKRPRGHGRQPVCWPLGGKEPKPAPRRFSLTWITTSNSQRQLGQS